MYKPLIINMKIFISLLFLFMLFSCVSPKQYAILKDENKTLKTEVSNLNTKIDGLDKQNTEYLKQLEQLSKQLNDAK
jgi:hypothetical protein